MRRILSLVAGVVVCSLLASCGTHDGTGDPVDPGARPIEIARTTQASAVSQQLTVTECPNVTWPDPGANACAVVSGNTWTLYQGSVLAPNAVFHGGQVLVSPTGAITCVGCGCDTGQPSARKVTCEHGVISPGLINTHDHINYVGNAPSTNTTKYDNRQAWRGAITGATTSDTNVIGAGELRQVMGGTTSIVGQTAAPGLLRNLDKVDRTEMLPIQPVRSNVYPQGGFYNHLYHLDCVFSDPPATIDNKDTVAGEEAYEAHLAEGIDANAHSEIVCASTGDPNNKLLSSHTTFVHEMATDWTNAQALRTERTIVSWAPRSEVSLYGNGTPVTLLNAAGVPIALGTDWILTGSSTMLRELKCADSLNAKYGNYFSDFQLWQMTTTNAALATHVDRVLGMLKPGYIADLAIFNGTTNHDHRAIIAANPLDVLLVTRSNKAIYGDSALMGSLSPACTDAWDVCGVQRKGCTSEVGSSVTFSTLQAAMGAIPIVQCTDPPPGEPTCTPARPAQTVPATLPAYNAGQQPPDPNDIDGDGILDVISNNPNDLCPGFFNPQRLMDATPQPNSDTDNIPDMCDRCPGVNGTGCTPPDADDIDGDTKLNASDNCPFDANPSQTDTDNDGKGNACDACPNTANPGLRACPLPVTTVRDPAATGHPLQDRRVYMQGLVVSAVRPSGQDPIGLYAQSPTAAQYGGIFVSTATVPTIPVGTVIDVYGTYRETNTADLTTSTSETLNSGIDVHTGVGAVFPLTPLPYTTIATPASAEPYESMWVAVNSDVTSLAALSNDRTKVTGNLYVDDDLSPAMTSVAVGTVIPKLTGVVYYNSFYTKSELLALYPIETVRDTTHPFHPATGTSVTLRNLYVTGVRPGPGTSQGFYAQSNALVPYGGIFVWTHTTTPSVAVGNIVDVTGTTTTWYGLDEIDVPDVSQIVVTSTSTTLPFSASAMDPSTIATGGANVVAYQSMLLKVPNASVQHVYVVTPNPDAPSDFDEFAVTGNLRIDDELYTALGNDYANGTPFTSITGVLTFSFSNSKLIPRNAADLVP